MLLANAMKCPDGTIIQSKHRHDYVEYIDKDGDYFMIDGGISYQRYSNESGKGELITITSDDDITTIREWMYWGKNYEKDGTLLPKTEWVKLKDITDDHLDGLIQYWKDRQNREYMENRKEILDVFEREKRFRVIEKI